MNLSQKVAAGRGVTTKGSKRGEKQETAETNFFFSPLCLSGTSSALGLKFISDSLFEILGGVRGFVLGLAFSK